MGVKIYVDTRQHEGKHELKNKWWTDRGVELVREKLDFGDYATDRSNICVDTKASIDEIAQNINGRNHARFRRECQRAAAAGYRLVILIENSDGVLSIEDLPAWTNGHCRSCWFYRDGLCNPRENGRCEKHDKPNKPIQGERLAKAMMTMSERYGVLFRFCTPDMTARYICAMLGVSPDWLCCDCYRYEDGACRPAEDGRIVDGPGVRVDGALSMCAEGVPF